MGLPRYRYSEVFHNSIPGRLRLKVRGMRRNRTLTQNMAYEVGSLAGVDGVNANELTGTLLVEFSEETTESAIRAHVDQILVDLIDSLQKATPAASQYHRYVDQWFRSRRRYRDAHAKQIADVIKDLRTDPKVGLDRKEAEHRLKKKGANVLPKPLPESDVKVFFKQYGNAPAAVLGASAVFSAMSGDYSDAVLISAVLMTNGIIGYRQDTQAHQTFDQFQNIDDRQSVEVIRNARIRRIDSRNLVPGDLVMLRSGTISSDMRLIEANGLSVNESMLTGESLPVEKNPDAIYSEHSAMGDRLNLLYKGTNIARGSGKALVTNTGAGTALGFMAQSSDASQLENTSSLRRLEDLNNFTVKASLLLCAGAFGIALLKRQSFINASKLLLALAVASVPEGLPMIGTVCFAAGAKRTRRFGINMKSLSAVDRLSEIDTICFDKTGTLTFDKMKVSTLLINGSVYECRDANTIFDLPGITTAHKTKLAEIMTLCTEYGVFGSKGPPSGTEKALLEFSGLGVDSKKIKAHQLRTTKNDYMWVKASTQQGKSELLVKGNPHTLLQRCSRYVGRNGMSRELAEATKQGISNKLNTMATSGLRLMGFARSNSGDSSSGWEWLGAVGLEDPLRPGVADWFLALQRQGINICIITGDQKETTEAILKQLKVSCGNKLNDIKVFSRVSPTQKQGIISGLKQEGRRVMMIGDGMNDAPAIAGSDLGVAIMQNASQFRLRQGDIFVEPANLGRLPEAIELSRGLRIHLNRSIRFILSTNFAELLASFIGVTIGTSATFSAKQLLWVNLLTDVFPGMALALQKDRFIAEEEEKNVAVASSRDNLLTVLEGVVMAGGILSTMGLLRYGTGDAEKARSGALVSLVWGQMLQAIRLGGYSPLDFATRYNEVDPYLRRAVILLSVSALLGSTIPGASMLLGNKRLAPGDVVYPLIGACIQAAGFKILNEQSTSLGILKEDKNVYQFV